MTHRPGRSAAFISQLAAVTALACVTTLAASAARATTVTDGSGILNTFSGSPYSPDLNAVSASAVFNSNDVFLSATMAGAIGLTAAKSQAHGGTDQGIYIWGVDRGAGTALLDHPTGLTDTSTPIGAGVNFDAFIDLNNLFNGTGDGFVVLLDEHANFVSKTDLAAGSVTFSGDTINVVVPLSLLPGQGATVADYGYNIWPRLNGIQSNALVASFLPSDHDFNASAVPEPAAWALMIMGFGMAGGMVRARRRVAAV
jgi:hypothetical protein